MLMEAAASVVVVKVISRGLSTNGVESSVSLLPVGQATLFARRRLLVGTYTVLYVEAVIGDCQLSLGDVVRGDWW